MPKHNTAGYWFGVLFINHLYTGSSKFRESYVYTDRDMSWFIDIDEPIYSGLFTHQEIVEDLLQSLKKFGKKCKVL